MEDDSLEEIDIESTLTYVPHRVFINNVDSYHGKILATVLADQIYGPDGREEVGEEMGEEEHKPMETFKAKMEVVGTVQSKLYKKTEDVHLVIEEDDNFEKNVLKCGFIVFDITLDSKEIQKALNILQAIENHLDQEKADGPKAYEESSEKRVFILISTVLTWANTKPIDPEDPDLPFTETDFKKRRTHPNFKQHIDLEKDVMQRAKKHKDRFNTIVLAVGITYGLEEADLHMLFKKAWHNAHELPIIQPGSNTIPLLHVKDLTSIISALIDRGPKKPKYILGVEQTPSTQKKMVKAISKSMGPGKVKMVNKTEAFLIPELSQDYYDKMTINVKMEPNYILNDLEVTFQSDLNFCENINKVCQEFKESRKLLPLRIFMHGPPAVGKTTISKNLCKLYDLHYISVASLIEESIKEMHENLAYARAQLAAKETKEEEEEEEAAEEEEDEEEDQEAIIAEMTERLKDIETALAEGENGRLPDDTIIEMLKAKLESNPFQNQGYVLDGYPKTTQQTKDLFGFDDGDDEEGGEEEAEEDEGESKKIIIPQHVISLEADDEFLCCRLIRMPEKQVQGTHYTEERMAPRLSEYRRNNTEDLTLLNLFDVREIHPVMIDATTDIQEKLIEIIQRKVGPKNGYPLTEAELDAIQQKLDEEIREAARIAEEEKKELEERMTRERQQNMETWIDLTNALQEQEEQILAAQNKPLREYLMKFVFPTLTKGLLEVSRIKPDDPIDYLAEYLFKQNPEGRMFDPSYVQQADDLMKTIRDFQHKVSDFLKIKEC